MQYTMSPCMPMVASMRHQGFERVLVPVASVAAGRNERDGRLPLCACGGTARFGSGAGET